MTQLHHFQRFNLLTWKSPTFHLPCIVCVVDFVGRFRSSPLFSAPPIEGARAMSRSRLARGSSPPRWRSVEGRAGHVFILIAAGLALESRPGAGHVYHRRQHHRQRQHVAGGRFLGNGIRPHRRRNGHVAEVHQYEHLEFSLVSITLVPPSGSGYERDHPRQQRPGQLRLGWNIEGVGDYGRERQGRDPVEKHEHGTGLHLADERGDVGEQRKSGHAGLHVGDTIRCLRKTKDAR